MRSYTNSSTLIVLFIFSLKLQHYSQFYSRFMWLQNWLSSAVWYMIVCCMGYYTVFSHIVIFCLADSVWETNFIYVTIKFCVNMTMRREWFLPTWHAAITRCPRSRSRRRASVTISPVVMEVPALIHYRVGEFWPPPPTPTPPFNPHLPLYRIWHFIHWTLGGTDLHGFILL